MIVRAYYLMKKIIYSTLLSAARVFRGNKYVLDPDISVSALIALAWRRAYALFRAFIRGIALQNKCVLFVGSNVKLHNRKMIKLGKGVMLSDFVLIDGLSREGVVLGKGVNVGPYTRIEATGVVTNLGEGCRIGANSGIGAFSYIGAAGRVIIGENVIMGQYVSFHSENHCFDRVDSLIREQGVTREGIVIEDDCWIGAKVTFLDGSYVGKGSVIAAGAVVRGHIPPYSVAAGVPARVIKNRKVGVNV